MSNITEQLRKEIETFELEPSYVERICMWVVSKDLRGEFTFTNLEDQECRRTSCMTHKGQLILKVRVMPHFPCDAVASRAFDGDIKSELVFAYIENGYGRGYHLGRLEWYGSTSHLMGRMSGVTNAGTHRNPLAPYESCDRRGHIEGRLDAVVVDGDHKDCRVIATYVIDFDPSLKAAGSGLLGTLEGVLICPCED
jgi:hypothetical protein